MRIHNYDTLKRLHPQYRVHEANPKVKNKQNKRSTVITVYKNQQTK